MPSITAPKYEINGFCVPTTLNSAILWYELVGSVYLAAKCKAAGYFPVVKSPTNRTCQLITAQISNCLIYQNDERCACLDNKISVTIDTNGVLSYQCFFTFNYTQNCKTYRVNSGVYTCYTCYTGYTVVSTST